MNWKLIQERAGVDSRCRKRLEEKRQFDQMSREEKKEWCLSIAKLYWKEVNKLDGGEIKTLDRALAEISDDSKDLEELTLLDKAQILNFQLDAIELTDVSDFNPDEFFDVRSAILHLWEELGIFEGIREVREIAQKYPEPEKFQEMIQERITFIDKELSKIKEVKGRH